MKRPPIERLFSVLSSAVRQHGIKPRWQSIGSLIDALALDKDNDDIVAWMCETMHSSEHLTRSAFCCAFFEYIGLQSVSAVIQDAWESESLKDMQARLGKLPDDRVSKRRTTRRSSK